MRFFGENYRPLRQLFPETGEFLETLIITQKYLIWFILSSFFITFFIISRSTDVKFDLFKFFLVRGKFLWERVLAIEAGYKMKKHNPMQKKTLTTT